MRESGSATGFCAQLPLVQHFGLKAGNSYRASVVFPSGAEVIEKNITAGALLQIEEPR